MKVRIGAPVLAVALSGAAVVAVMREPDQALRRATISEPTPAEAMDAPPREGTSRPAQEQHAVPVASLAKPRFAWPIPVSVPVVERVTKADGDATLSYRLEVCPRPDGHLTISHRNVEVTRLQGRDAADSTVAAAVLQLAPLLSAIPVFVVDRAGLLVEVEGIDDMLQRMGKTMPLRDWGKVRAVLKDQSARSVLAAAIGERWQAWVGLWTRFRPEKGERQIVTDMIPATAASVESEVVVKRIWSAQRVQLSRRTVIDSQQAHAAGNVLGRTLGIPDISLTDYSLSGEMLIEADLVWPTLQPKIARTRKTITLTRDDAAESRIETHEYEFGPWTDFKPDCRSPQGSPAALASARSSE